VRRHQGVHHREPGDHGQAHHQQRHPDPPRHGEGNWHQQYEAHFEEQRQPHQEGDADHGPVGVAFAEAVDQGARHLLGTTGFGHQLAEHGAQCHHQGDMPQGLANPGLVGAHHSGRRHAGHQRQAHRHQGDDDKGVESVAGDQHDQRNDGDCGVAQQPRTRSGSHGVLLENSVTFEWL